MIFPKKVLVAWLLHQTNALTLEPMGTTVKGMKEGDVVLDISGLQSKHLNEVKNLNIPFDTKGKNTVQFKRRGPSNNGVNSFFGQDDSGKVTINALETVHSDGRTCLTASSVDMENEIISRIGCDGDGNVIVHNTPMSEYPEDSPPVEVEDVLTIQERPQTRPPQSARPPRTLRKLQSKVRMDVMVVWTKKAECANSNKGSNCAVDDTTYDNMMDLSELAVFETNTAYDLSGINAELRLVHAYREPDYVEASSDAFGAALGQIRSTNDGIMDDVHNKRTEHGADIVAMLIDDGQYCGLGYLGPNIGYMFSVSSWSCATGYFTFGHEIGHNQGCNHDKGTNGACGTSSYNYGYRDPNGDFRTIMAYNCRTDQCDNNPSTYCAKTQRFSTPDPAYNHNGKAVGEANANNAQRINDVAQIIADYYDEVPSGPTPPPTPAPTKTPLCSSPSEVLVEVTSDNWPGDISWYLKNEETGEEILSGGDYTDANTLFTDSGPICPGTYEFRIDDSWGDGLCCSYGNGGYSVKVDGDVVASGAEYTSFESTTFTVGGSTTPAPVVPPSPAPSVPPTPAPVVPPTPAPVVPPTSAPVVPPTPSPTTPSPVSPPGTPPTPYPTEKAPTPHPTGRAPTPWPTHTPPTPHPTGALPV